MFKVTCPGCIAPYQVDERKVPDSGLLMRCPRCAQRFRVRPPGEPPPDTSPWRRRSSPLQRSVLVSFRPADCGWAARAIRTRIEQELGDDAVFDMVEGDAPVSSEFARRVEESLRDVSVVLAIVGKKWTGRREGTRRIDVPTDPVHRELKVALASGVTMFVVLVDDAKLPGKLPHALAPLASKADLVVHADDRFSSDMKSLLDEIRAALDATGRGREAGVSTNPPPAGASSHPVVEATRLEVHPAPTPSESQAEDVTAVSGLLGLELPSPSSTALAPASSPLFTPEELKAITEPPAPASERLSSLPSPASLYPSAADGWVKLTDPEDPAIAELVAELAATRTKLGDARPVNHEDMVDSLGRGVKNARDMRRGLLVRIAAAESRASIQRKLA